MGCKSSKSKKGAYARVAQYQKESWAYEHCLKRNPAPLEWAVSSTGGITASSLHNLLTDGFYSPFSKNPHYLLLIDCRSEMEYSKRTLMASHWFQNLSQCPPPHSCFSIVLFDGIPRTTPPLPSENSPLSFIYHEFKKQQLDPKFVIGGWPMIDIICRHLQVSGIAPLYIKETLPWFPSLLIPGFLYLGQVEVATDLKILSQLKITHIIALSDVVPRRVHASTSYLIVPIEEGDPVSVRDNTKSGKRRCDLNLASSMPTILAFLNEAKSLGGSVLVCCDQGFTRSAIVSMAILMAETQCTLEDAFYYVRDARSAVHPHHSLLEQLLQYETKIFGTPISDIDGFI